MLRCKEKSRSNLVGVGLLWAHIMRTVQYVGWYACVALRVLMRHRCTWLEMAVVVGLTAVLNAPLAGIVCVMESLRQEASSIVSRLILLALSADYSAMVLFGMLGSTNKMTPVFDAPEPQWFVLFCVLGGLCVGLSSLFNYAFHAVFQRLSGVVLRRLYRLMLLVSSALLINLCLRLGAANHPVPVLELLLTVPVGTGMLLLFMCAVVLMRKLSNVMRVPGGVCIFLGFIGASFGLLTASVLQCVLPSTPVESGLLVLAGLAGIFSATTVTPIAGIVLVMEITRQYGFILPLVLTCLTAKQLASWLGVQSVFTQFNALVLLKKDHHPLEVN